MGSKGLIGAGLTIGGFRAAMEAANQVALEVRAQPVDDTPARRVRRMAEAVVLPERFNATYLGHYFREESPVFHRLLYWALETEHHLAVRVPRGFSKSTVVTFAYVLHQVTCARVLQAWEEGTLAAAEPELAAAIREVMAEELERRRDAGPQTPESLGLPMHFDPKVDNKLHGWLVKWHLHQVAATEIPLHWDPFIQIVASDVGLAIEFGDAIRGELARNAGLRADWGDLTPVRTGDWGRPTPGASSQEDWESNGVRVAMYGMLGEIRGGKHGPHRPRLAIFDDCDGERSSRTLNQRDHNENVVDAAVENGLEPGVGRVMVLGTPHHPDCVVVRKTEKEESREGWTAIRFRSRDEQGRLLFPARFSAAILADKFTRLRGKAEPELGDRPPRLGNRPFRQVHHYDRRVWDGVPLPKILAADPSYGKNAQSDYQAAIVLRGPTPEPRPRILVHRVEFWRFADPEEYVDNLNRLHAEEAPDYALIEGIALGYLLQMLAMARGRRQGLFVGWNRIDRHEESKDLRVQGTAPLVNDGTLVTPSDGSCRELELQWMQWGEARSRRDGPDVAQMALERLRLLTGQVVASGPGARLGARRRFGDEARRRR